MYAATASDSTSCTQHGVWFGIQQPLRCRRSFAPPGSAASSAADTIYEDSFGNLSSHYSPGGGAAADDAIYEVVANTGGDLHGCYQPLFYCFTVSFMSCLRFYDAILYCNTFVYLRAVELDGRR